MTQVGKFGAAAFLAAVAVSVLAAYFMTVRLSHRVISESRELDSVQAQMKSDRNAERQALNNIQQQMDRDSRAYAAGIPMPVAGAVPVPVPMVVDTDGIIANCAAGKGILAEVSAKAHDYQILMEKLSDHLRAEKQDLDTQQQQLNKNGNPASEQAFRQSVAAFEQEVQTDQTDSQNKGRALEAAKEEALTKVNQALYDIVRDIAQERHANLVLQESQLIVYDQAYDATRETLDRLNATLPVVKIVIPTLPANDNTTQGQGQDQGQAAGQDPGQSQGQGQ
jgi:outer membrane protein